MLIYYSGHGILQGERGFWQPFDAQKDKASTYFSYANLKEYIRDIAARHVLVIADSCYSGQLLFRGEEDQAKSINRPFFEMNRHKSRWLLASGREYEKVSDGTPGKNSPFANALLNYLGGNQADFLNISRLGQDVIGQVANNYRQHPTSNSFSNLGHHPHGEYIFRKKGAVLAPPKGSNIAPPLLPENTKNLLTKRNVLNWVIGITSLVLLTFISFQIIQNNNKSPVVDNPTTQNLQKEDTLQKSKKIETEVPTTRPQKEENKSSSTVIERPKNQPIRRPNAAKSINDEKGNTYQVLSLGKLQWTKENLVFETSINSSCYNFEVSNCEKYGRLYSYETANKVCTSLGNGWRLPDVNEFRKHFNDLKMKANLPLGGMISGESNNSSKINENGFYWLANGVRIKTNQRHILDDIDYAPKEDLFSCKCVKAL